MYVFKGRIYFGNTYYFYLLLSIFLILGLLLFFKVITPDLKLSTGLTPSLIGIYISFFSSVCMVWMTLWTLNIFQWYTVDKEGVALIRFGFIFKKFYFRDLSSIVKLSTEETRELLYKEYAPRLMFRRAPMEGLSATIDKIPRAFELGRDLTNLVRHITAPIIVGGFKTGYQYPTIEDAKKAIHFYMSGSYILLTTKESKHILVSPVDIDGFIDIANKMFRSPEA